MSSVSSPWVWKPLTLLIVKLASDVLNIDSSSLLWVGITIPDLQQVSLMAEKSKK